MDHGDHPRVRVHVERVHQRLVRHAVAPVRLDRDDPSAVPPRDLADALPEEPALPHDHGVARLEQVRDAGLHPGGTAAVEREDEPVGHPVDAPQHVDDVEQDVVKVRVEVAEHRLPHRVEHGRVYVRGSGAAQESLGRPQLGEFHHVRVPEAHREYKLRVLRNT